MRKILAYSDQYTRIRKDVARRLYKEGRTIYLTPSNIAARDSNLWVKPFPIQSISGIPGVPFDTKVNEFEYYNCNHELGYYTNFWIIEEETKSEK